jgi:hypothetical protein
MSEWVDIPLATQMGEDAASPFASDMELTNLHLKENPPGSRTPFHIAGVPALTATGSNGVALAAPATGNWRGFLIAEAGFTRRAWAIIGTTVYYSGNLTSWTAVPVGTMPGSALCNMVAAGDYVVAVDGTNARAITTAESFAVSRGDFIDVAYQDGYTIFAEEGSQSIYVSSIDDPTTVGALDFTTVDAADGKIQAIIVDHRELFVFKEYAIEHYYNAGGTGFPFVRASPGLIELGVAAAVTIRHSVRKYGNAIYWVGADRRVYRMRGYAPEPISTPWVENIMRARLTGTQAFYASVYTYGGVPYYQIHQVLNAGGTESYDLVYDIKNGLWHKRFSPLTYSGGTGAFNFAVFDTDQFAAAVASGRPVVVGRNNGNTASALYLLDTPTDSGVYNDAGASSQTSRIMTLPQIAPGEGRRAFMPELYLDMEKSSETSTVSLTWSDDGGATYTSAKTANPSTARVRWQRLGAFFQRILRFTLQVNDRIAITGVRARIEVGE